MSDWTSDAPGVTRKITVQDLPPPRSNVRMRTPHTCGACEKEFKPRRSNAHYCSAACKQKAYWRRQFVAKETRRERDFASPAPAAEPPGANGESESDETR